MHKVRILRVVELFVKNDKGQIVRKKCSPGDDVEIEELNKKDIEEMGYYRPYASQILTANGTAAKLSNTSEIPVNKITDVANALSTAIAKAQEVLSSLSSIANSQAPSLNEMPIAQDVSGISAETFITPNEVINQPYTASDLYNRNQKVTDIIKRNMGVDKNHEAEIPRINNKLPRFSKTNVVNVANISVEDTNTFLGIKDKVETVSTVTLINDENDRLNPFLTLGATIK